MEIIDCHCHIGEHLEFGQTPEELLRIMDEYSIAQAVIGPMGRSLLLNIRQANEIIARTVERYPNRFIGFGTVNPWYDNVLDELDYAIKALGLRGILLEPALQGFPVNHAMVYPLMQRVVELGVPIHIQVGSPEYSLSGQISDLADHFPDAKIIIGSMRSDFWFDVRSSVERVNNIWLETSCCVVETELKAILKSIDSERVLFGTDLPYYSIAALMARVELLGLDGIDAENVYYRNITRLLALEGC
ncbi:MAG: amidohydrolase family protein [Firmicutes bacterium]|nr:amidohydrolase family protein [Bacillota bacterium]